MTTEPISRHSRCVAHRLVVTIGVLLLAISCRDTPTEKTEGETHFLQQCGAQSATCDPGMACVCGLCTQSCVAEKACRGLAATADCIAVAEHAASASCSEPATSAYCDLRCASDADCHILSHLHRCTDGFCRMQSGVAENGAGGTAGTSRTGAVAAGTNATVDDTGKSLCSDSNVAGNEVLVLGDMFVAQSHQITTYLEDVARNLGKLAAGERFRDYSSVAENSLALGDTYIANQYATGEAEGTARVVLICGGGADVLGGYCASPPEADCKSLVDAATAADQLLAQMAQDGIEHVVWFMYPDPLDAAMRAKMDLLRPLLQNVCASSAVPCHWLDLRATFAGNYAKYIRADGMTPTDSGAQASAAAIWAVMQQSCIAQ